MDSEYTVKFVCREDANTVEMGMFQLMYSREYVSAYNVFCEISNSMLDDFNKQYADLEQDVYYEKLKNVYDGICKGINTSFGRKPDDPVHFEIFTDAGIPLFGMNVFGKIYSFVLERKEIVA